MAKDSTYPEELHLGQGTSPLRLLRKTNYYAILGKLPSKIKGKLVLRIGENDATIVQGAPPHLPQNLVCRVAPVYVTEESGSYAVPTGVISIRAVEGSDIEELRSQIEESGYRIKEIPRYARHAGLLTARSGSVAQALSGLERLTAIPRVVAVEPQVLRAVYVKA